MLPSDLKVSMVVPTPLRTLGCSIRFVERVTLLSSVQTAPWLVSMRTHRHSSSLKHTHRPSQRKHRLQRPAGCHHSGLRLMTTVSPWVTVSTEAALWAVERSVANPTSAAQMPLSQQLSVRALAQALWAAHS